MERKREQRSSRSVITDETEGTVVPDSLRFGKIDIDHLTRRRCTRAMPHEPKIEKTGDEARQTSHTHTSDTEAEGQLKFPTEASSNSRCTSIYDPTHHQHHTS